MDQEMELAAFEGLARNPSVPIKDRLAMALQVIDGLNERIDVKWKRFDYADKKNTAPPEGKLVWIHEEHYHGVIPGQFDGFTMTTYWGSDDVRVTHWAEMETPNPPEGVPGPGSGDEDDD